MSVAVAKAPNKTLSCPDCGSWDAVWTSKFMGADVEHDGDVALWCPQCSKIYDVLVSESVVDVRMSPEDVSWADRDEWWHVSGSGWDEHCPEEVYIHLGRREVSEWLWRIRQGTSEEIKNPVLHRVRVKSGMPKRLIVDQGDFWDNRRVAYVQLFEVPGSVCLYLPKRDIEIVDKVEL